MDTMPDPAGLTKEITDFFPEANGCKVFMLRLDRLHPIISGNKWFKLKYNLGAAIQSGAEHIITFGGAYSNHLAATAVAAYDAGISVTGVVRGLHAKEKRTPTLQACLNNGMKLHFVSRADYDLKDDPDFLEKLQAQLGRSYIIPEGGNNEAGRKGTAEIARYISSDANTVCLPVGTGATFSGLRSALPASIRMLGFTAMKGGEYLQTEIIENPANCQLITAYSFNGFAKTTPELLHFMRRFYQQTSIPLDIVYTGKMMFGIQDLLRQSFFKDEQIVCIHTGGLQGNPPGLFATL